MGLTNEFERNLNDQAGLKRPGRIDLRVFQNTPDAGDGHPGLQRCFRNYLHEGGMEKDLDLVAYSIKGTSVDINNAELQQLSNIGAATISTAQWGYVGEADQPVKQADSPTFVGLTLSADVVTTSTFDSVDVGDLKIAFDNHKASTGADHSYIDQSIVITSSPTFVGLTLSANIVTTSTVDGVDVSVHDHSGGNKGVNVPFTSLSGDIVYTQLDSIVDTSGVGSTNKISGAQHTHTDADGSSKITHANTSGRTANDHHNQSHVFGGGDHTASGLTIGHVIRATGATTFAWQQLPHSNLSGVGSNAHSVIDTHLGDHLKHNNIAQCTMLGTDGFSMAASFGPYWEVLCSDTLAYIHASFIVQDAGTYRVHIISSGSADGGVSDYANGEINIGAIAMGGEFIWNVANAQSANLLLWQYQPRPKGYEYMTNVTVASNESIVYVRWKKNNNVNGRNGYLRIHNIYLERTA